MLDRDAQFHSLSERRRYDEKTDACICAIQFLVILSEDLCALGVDGVAQRDIASDCLSSSKRHSLGSAPEVSILRSGKARRTPTRSIDLEALFTHTPISKPPRNHMFPSIPSSHPPPPR
ncbi:hypothetical protein NMY22_g13145 [Coprinellus aureogranulatus]|nr:hypothetical protein NMY22_g13145 [Coprinellus aureogranulatus]